MFINWAVTALKRVETYQFDAQSLFGTDAHKLTALVQSSYDDDSQGALDSEQKFLPSKAGRRTPLVRTAVGDFARRGGVFEIGLSRRAGE